MQQTANEVLAQLKDIQQPAAISMWPPAVGWWLLLALLILGVFVLALFLLPRWQHRRTQQRWRSQLQAYAETAKDPRQCHAILIQLSQVLRTIAQQAYPEQAAGQLLGSDWLAFLNKSSERAVFSGKLGKALVIGPYSPTIVLTDPEREKLFAEVTTWVLKHV